MSRSLGSRSLARRSLARRNLSRKHTPRHERISKPSHRIFGYSLHIDMNGCNANGHKDAIIRLFNETLVKRIHKKANGKPIIRHFGKGIRKGYTLIQLIETSSITAYFMDYADDAYIDIFSCDYFNPDDALEVVKDFFQPTDIHSTFLQRGHL